MFVCNEEKYNALHSIIDFFSQNLHLDQIVEYGFNIYNSLEMPIASSIYVLNREKEVYERRFIYGDVVNEHLLIPKAYNHDTFAVRNGFFLTTRELQSRYFSEEVLDACEVMSIMPLIIDDLLFGFVFSKHQESETLMGEAFLSRFNFLMNLSLEKASRYIERETLKKEIDKRIFNLDALSHTVKLLLSELTLTGILNLAVEVIQETCANCNAAIGTYDEIDKKIKVETFSSVHSFSTTYEEFSLKEGIEGVDKIIFDVEKDFAILEDIFYEADKLKAMNAKYALFLVNQNIQGVLLISQRTPMPLTQDIRDRFMDVAGILMIGIRNAKQFKVIEEQKAHLDKNIKVMVRMNKLLKDINSSETFEELMEQIMDMVQLTFGVEKAFLVDESGVLRYTEMQEEPLEVLNQGYHFKDLFSSEMEIYYTKVSALVDYPWLESFFEDFNCLIIAPIKVSQYSDEVLAYLIVSRTKKRLHETQVQMLELLVNSVAPIMQQLKQVAMYQSSYIENPKMKLRRLYELYECEFKDYEIPFYVYLLKLDLKPFEELSLEVFHQHQVVLLNGYLVVFSSEEVEDALIHKRLETESPTWEDVVTFLS